jgi:hypothetical protein
VGINIFQCNGNQSTEIHQDFCTYRVSRNECLSAKGHFCDKVKLKVKLSRYRPEQAQRVDRGIALPFLDRGARRGWVVSTTHRPLYPREIPSIHFTEGWVGPRAGLDMCEKSRPHWDSIPGLSSP